MRLAAILLLVTLVTDHLHPTEPIVFSGVKFGNYKQLDTAIVLSKPFGDPHWPWLLSNIDAGDARYLLEDQINGNKVANVGKKLGFYLITTRGEVYTDADCKGIHNGWCMSQGKWEHRWPKP